MSQHLRYFLPLLAATCCLSSAGAQSSRPIDEPGPIFPERLTATELVRVVFPADTEILSHSAIEVLLNGTAVRCKAANEVLGLTFDQADSVNVSFVSPEGVAAAVKQGEHQTSLIGVLTVSAYKKAGVTVEKMDALVNRMCSLATDVLSNAIAPDRPALTEQRRIYAEQLPEARSELGNARNNEAELRASNPDFDITNRERVSDQLAEAVERANHFEQERKAQQARRLALGEQIARVAQEVERAVENDGAVAELARVIALREQKLELRRAVHATGSVSEAELADAEEQVVLARAELARQKQQVAQSVGGGLLARLNEELVMLAVQMTETEVRASLAAEHLERCRNASEAARRDEDARMKVMDLETSVSRLEHEMERLDGVLNQPLPRVQIRVIGAAPAAPAANP